MFTSNICRFSFFLLISSTICSIHVFAQNVELKPGYWQYQQSTLINGSAAPGRDLTGGECLLKEDSKQPVDYYIGKFQAGLGPESQCSMSNLRESSQQVIFDLECQSEGGIQSNHQIQYRYSATTVDVDSKGTLSTGGLSLAINAKNTSNWVRDCTQEEQQLTRQYRNINEQEAFTTPVAKPLFTIGPKGAGPIKDSLVFDKNTIQKLFPGFSISKGEIQDNYGQRDAFIVRDKKDKKAIFYIDSRQSSNVAFSVSTTSDVVTGPQGERIGVTTLEDIAKASESKRHLCSLGKNRLSQTVVCLDGKFRSLYEPPKSVLRKYNSGDVIPDNELNQAVLSEMRYFLGYPKKQSARSPNEIESNKIFDLSPSRFYAGLKKLDTDKPVIVHFTSTDGSCPHCMRNNKVFAEFHKKHQDDYTFAQVVFNPWRTYLKKFKRLGGLPVTEFYHDKVAIHKVVGYNAKLPEALIGIHKITENILADAYNDVDIKVVDSPSLDRFLKAQDPEKFVLVNLSSIDEDCPSCVKHNKFFRYATRQHQDDVVFSEMLYKSVNAAKKDSVLGQFLAFHKNKIQGLPATLICKNGKVLNLRPGIWSSASDDLAKFLKRK